VPGQRFQGGSTPDRGYRASTPGETPPGVLSPRTGHHAGHGHHVSGPGTTGTGARSLPTRPGHRRQPGRHGGRESKAHELRLSQHRTRCKRAWGSFPMPKVNLPERRERTSAGTP
jgi:hypothetical protein